MTATLADLTKPRTAAEHEALIIAKAQAEKLPATSWQSGSVPLTMIKAQADTSADSDALIAEIAKAGFLGTAEGDWLGLHAIGRYGITRRPASYAEHDVTLTAAPDAGPHTIEAGKIWFASTSGKRFVNTSGGTLVLGGSLVVSVRAEMPGASYNVGAGEISLLLTSLPGVTCSNVNGPRVQGLDDESPEALRQRCRDRWSTLGRGATDGAYRFWALSADVTVSRVAVRASPTAPGTTQVMIAGPSEAVTEATRLAVEKYIRERKPLIDGLEVIAASNRQVSVGGTVYARDPAAAEAAVAQVLLALQNELPIGGVVYVAELIERIMGCPGVVNVTAPMPADVLLAPAEVVVLVPAITYRKA